MKTLVHALSNYYKDKFRHLPLANSLKDDIRLFIHLSLDFFFSHTNKVLVFKSMTSNFMTSVIVLLNDFNIGLHTICSVCAGIKNITVLKILLARFFLPKKKIGLM